MLTAPRRALPARASVAVLVAAATVLLAGPALAHTADSDHSHGGLTGFEDAVFLDPIIWDGTSTVDCRLTGEGTISWTLTGSDDIEYAELHIDAPERSIVRRTGGPYVWVSPLYALDTIEADVDRIVGVLADDATFTAVTCPEGGAEEVATEAAPPATPEPSAPVTATPVAADAERDAGPSGLLQVAGGIAAGGLLGFLLGARRRSA